MEIAPELIAEVQQRADTRRSASSRRRCIRAMETERHEEADLLFVLEWIALTRNVSGARAAEMLIEKLADGSIQVAGRQQRPDGSLGPREERAGGIFSRPSARNPLAGLALPF